MEATGLWVTFLSALGIAAIGLLYLLRPRMIATGFGLPTLPPREATAWLRLKGGRDLATGVAAGVLLVTASPHVIGWMLLAFALIPIGDAVTVATSRGKIAAAWGVHGVTALVLIVGAVLLLIGSR